MNDETQWGNGNSGPRRKSGQDLSYDWDAGERLLLKVPEVSRALGVSRTTVYELIADGQLRSVKIGASRRVRREDLSAYVSGLQAAS